MTRRAMAARLAGVLIAIATVAGPAAAQDGRPTLFEHDPGGARITHSLAVPAWEGMRLNHGIFGLRAGQAVTFQPPGGAQREIRFERRIVHPEGLETWIGHIDSGEKRYRTVITTGPTGSYGQIATPEGGYLVRPGAGGERLIDLKTTRPLPAGFAEDFAHAADHDAAPSTDGTMAREEDNRLSAAQATGGAVEIDLVVGYTQSLVDLDGEGVTTRIQNLVDLSNAVLADSGVQMTINLLHAQFVDYTEQTTNWEALQDLTDGAMPRAAGLGRLRKLAEGIGGDVVTLMRVLDSRVEGDNCGYAWVNTEGDGANPIDPQSARTFNTVRVGMDAGGEGYRCYEVTLVHEIGHNGGLRHDRIADPDSTAVFDYARGYRVPGAFKTVMGVGPEPREEGTDVFSNPMLDCNGYACGIDADEPNSAYASRALSEVAASLAAVGDSEGVLFAWIEEDDPSFVRVLQPGASTPVPLHVSNTLGNNTSFAWRSDCTTLDDFESDPGQPLLSDDGGFLDATVEDPVFIAPDNDTGLNHTCTVSVTATSKPGGETATASARILVPTAVSTDGTAKLRLALKPGGRAMEAGSRRPVTAFALIYNRAVSAPGDAANCGLAIDEAFAGEFNYVAFDTLAGGGAGAFSGGFDAPLPLAGRSVEDPGGMQVYVITFGAEAVIAPNEFALSPLCDNWAFEDTIPISGVNTFVFSADTAEPLDILTSNTILTPAPDHGAFMRVAGVYGQGRMLVRAMNLAGVGGELTVDPTTVPPAGGTPLNVTLRVCHLRDGLAELSNCKAPPSATVTTTVPAYDGSFERFLVLAEGNGTAIARDPAAHRLFVRFSDAGMNLRGIDSVGLEVIDDPDVAASGDDDGQQLAVSDR